MDKGFGDSFGVYCIHALSFLQDVVFKPADETAIFNYQCLTTDLSFYEYQSFTGILAIQ